MCLPWLAMRSVKKMFGKTAGYASLIVFWICFEYIHQEWELSWPWLTLGNVFAMKPHWVQWYEWTGATGGSLWVLGSNILLYQTITKYRIEGTTRRVYGSAILLLMLIGTPILISKSIESNYENMDKSVNNTAKNVVVVQPNVDPYDEKFTAGTEEKQIQHLLSLTQQKIDSATALVLWPETAIPVIVWENQIAQNYYYQPLWGFLQSHPNVSLLSGISSLRNYGRDKAASNTARLNEQDTTYYDVFNTAAILDSKMTVQFYHKAKLVPGVETLPSFLLWMGGLFEDFGGTSGTLGRDKHRTVFRDHQNYYVAAPIICYESIYSDDITEYVRKGANLLTIITNDGWWGNTQGYKQHMNYGRLRAIETRRWIARSANTGISCFIDPVGAIYQPQPWDTAGSIKMNIEPLQALTFFVRHGDYLSELATVASIIFLALLIIFKVKNRFFLKQPH